MKDLENFIKEQLILEYKETKYIPKELIKDITYKFNKQ